ncbi:prephenate dehydrogenase/arogenate dehydrogenase family protein [Bradyrhizobium sp. CCBAU 21359]|uniref:prephenate dehydrogenase/arogenate dehydrogenase family protein n=1 Tax=Bradyrhizobium sp. CCBAU 21359 TaxID=1325080 RepID=UPI0023054E77|nr:prephenate dehydrogenase/arogenate dehydrogenase family protein [Bradyrhizobium sp. CCBAU 21359]
MLAKLLRSYVQEIRCVDVRPEEGCQVGDAAAPSPALEHQIQSADLIVLALPDRLNEEVGPSILKLARTDCLIVDTSSVKTRYATVCSLHGSAEILSINPLFGPDLCVEGRSIAVSRVRSRTLAVRFERMLSNSGARVVSVSVDEHDRAAAVTQAVTHAILLTSARLFRESGWSPAPEFLAPPARAMLSMAARMLSGSSELYWAIQSRNPMAASARKAFLEHFAQLDRIILEGDQTEFSETWKLVLASIGNSADAFAREAAHVYRGQIESERKAEG